MIKALFFDIDGTLVSFKTCTVPSSTVKAIDLVKRKGIKVFISTGRPQVIINNLGNLQFDGYSTMNGSYCFVNQQKVIYKNSILRKDSEALAHFVGQHRIPCVFVDENHMKIYGRNEQTDHFYQMLRLPPLPETTLEEAVTKDMYQISPFITADEEVHIMPHLSACSLERWHPSFADIVATNNGKHKGMDEIIKHFGIDLADTMAFGDGGNDIGMLRHAGIGVAMGNAREEVKQAADYVTATVDEDGIMQALQHFNIL